MAELDEKFLSFVREIKDRSYRDGVVRAYWTVKDYPRLVRSSQRYLDAPHEYRQTIDEFLGEFEVAARLIADILKVTEDEIERP